MLSIGLFGFASTARRRTREVCWGDRASDAQLADLGPVVQSIVSLKSSLRGQLVKCFRTL